MRTLFADTSFWIAIANPRDRWHRRARALRQSLRPVQFFTTEEVLGELLTEKEPAASLAASAAVLRRVSRWLEPQGLPAPSIELSVGIQ